MVKAEDGGKSATKAVEKVEKKEPVKKAPAKKEEVKKASKE